MAVSIGYLREVPTIGQLWSNAGYEDESDRVDTIGPQWPFGPFDASDPGVHEDDPGGERVAVASAPELEEAGDGEDQILHLVQDDDQQKSGRVHI